MRNFNKVILARDAGCHGVFLFALLQATSGSCLRMLIQFLDDSNRVGSIGGDPGWSIDRRRPEGDPSEYAGWPDWAEYFIHVPETEVTFNCQHEYVTKERFENCLRRVLAAREIRTAPY